MLPPSWCIQGPAHVAIIISRPNISIRPTNRCSPRSHTNSVHSVQHLIVHAVHPLRPQQLDGLANQVRASTVEHPEAQVQMELIRGGLGVEALEGAEAALGPGGGAEREELQPGGKARARSPSAGVAPSGC